MRVDHVTVINKTVHPVLPRFERCNQYIIVIAVVVDYAPSQTAQLRLSVRPIVIQKTDNHGLVFFIRNRLGQASNDLSRIF